MCVCMERVYVCVYGTCICVYEKIKGFLLGSIVKCMRGKDFMQDELFPTINSNAVWSTYKASEG